MGWIRLDDRQVTLAEIIAGGLGCGQGGLKMHHDIQKPGHSI